jgi:hypothetical protein
MFRRNDRMIKFELEVKKGGLIKLRDMKTETKAMKEISLVTPNNDGDLLSAILPLLKEGARITLEIRHFKKTVMP